MSRHLPRLKTEMFRTILRRAESTPILLKVFGNSMLPELPNGSTIAFQPDRPIKSGGLALFVNHSSGRLVCHRVIEAACDCIVMKGDNEAYPVKIPASAILGACVPATSPDRMGVISANDESRGHKWIFDAIDENIYWMRHVWTGESHTGDMSDLTNFVSNPSQHSSATPVANIVFSDTGIESRHFDHWMFSAYYSPASMTLHFRCVQEASMCGIFFKSLLEKYHEWPNYYKRHLQYLGFLRAQTL